MQVKYVSYHHKKVRSPIHSVSFSHRAHVCKTRGEVILSRRTFLSLTELTDLTELFHQRFDPTERLQHTDITEAFQLRLAVTLCVIG